MICRSASPAASRPPRTDPAAHRLHRLQFVQKDGDATSNGRTSFAYDTAIWARPARRRHRQRSMWRTMTIVSISPMTAMR